MLDRCIVASGETRRQPGDVARSLAKPSRRTVDRDLCYARDRGL